MSSGAAKAYEKEEEYVELCKHFGEKPVDGRNPYTEHARLLEEMREKERKLHQEHLQQLKLRSEALAKLSVAEKKALGIRE